jgi:sugar lactone lactonase YvrE
MALIFANPAYSSTGTVLVGQSVTFSVTVDGTAPFSYQWYKDGTSLAGATGATCSIGSVQATDAGNYYAVVSNSAGSVTSDDATLIVDTAPAAPSFTTQPAVVGASVTFTAASGTPAPTFQWQKNGVNLAGATSASYTIASVATGDAGSYTVVVTSSTDSVTSDVAVLTVSLPAVATAPIVITTPLTVSTLAGQALSDGSADGTGSGVRFFCPSGVAVDNAGNFYVADTDNHTIRKVVAATGTVTTLAGLAGVSGNADGTGSDARFQNPSGVAVDGAGNVYVADTLNHTLRKVTSAGVVSTLAGTPGSSGSTDGTGSAAQFQGPQGLTIDSAGNLYVADTNNHTIRQVVPATGEVITIAGLAGNSGSTDGLGGTARFNYPSDVTIDSAGNLYVADTDNDTIRAIQPSGLVSTLAGLAGNSGSADGTGSAARFDSPSAVAVDLSGNVYVADTGNFTIRKVVPATGAASTLAGLAGTSGGTDGEGAAVRFFGPTGIAVDSHDNLYIADTNNHTIRLGLLPTAPSIQTQPQSQSVTAGSSAQFSVTASGRPAPTYQWYFKGTAISGATASSYSLASVQSGDAGDYTVTATNAMGSVTSNPATLTVNSVTSLSSSRSIDGGSDGGGGGGGAPSWWFVLALVLIGIVRSTVRRLKNAA